MPAWRTTHSADAVHEQQPVLAEPGQPAGHDVTAEQPHPEVLTERCVQPRGEAHPGVLGHAQVGDLGIPLHEVQPVGLLLEVVEHGEHRFFPAHAISHARAGQSQTICGQMFDTRRF